MKSALWRVTKRRFVCGLIVCSGRVAEAAPMLRWAEGQTWALVKGRLVMDGWHGKRLT